MSHLENIVFFLKLICLDIKILILKLMKCSQYVRKEIKEVFHTNDM